MITAYLGNEGKVKCKQESGGNISLLLDDPVYGNINILLTLQKGKAICRALGSAIEKGKENDKTRSKQKIS